MRLPRLRLALVVLLLVSPAVQAQDASGGFVGGAPGSQRPTPARDRPPAQSVQIGKGSLSGRITSADGLPLRRALVRLLGGVQGAQRSSFTDDQGAYSFIGLLPGRYSVTASKPGYVNLSYGQSVPGRPVRFLDVAAEQQVTGVDVVLPRGSAISGRVTDEYGEPVLQAQVQALRYEYQADGSRRLMPGPASAVTDDLGQFRLYGLNPGEYVISASVRQQFVAMIDRGSFTLGTGATIDGARPPEDGYAPTYYPGTSNPADAQPIVVGVGQELTAQLQLVPSRLARITGFVVDSQGRPATPGTQVMLRLDGSLNMNRSAPTNEEGMFNITGVPPGDYILDVRSRPFARPGERSGDQEFASVPLTVGGDVDGLRVVTGKGATISGHVVIEGSPPATGMRIRVVPQLAEPSRSIVLPPANRDGNEGVVAADGSFTLTGITGPVFLRVTVDSSRGPSPQQIGYMTKSVLVDGLDMADVPFDPTRRGAAASVTVVLTDKVTEIGGTVSAGLNPPGEPVAVLIVPEELPRGISAQRFVRQLQTDNQGHFSVRAMPVGRYVAIAARSIEQGRQYDPALIQQVRQAGQSFSLREGEKVTLDLKLSSDF
jgi:protocatechuate 3,4-dioxygenase beta subunit